MGKERALSGPAGKGKPGKLRGQCPGDWGKGQKPGEAREGVGEGDQAGLG